MECGKCLEDAGGWVLQCKGCFLQLCDGICAQVRDANAVCRLAFFLVGVLALTMLLKSKLVCALD